MSTTPADTKVVEAPKPGSPEHDAAMAAKFENRDVVADKSVEETKPAAEKPAKPEGIPDKFWNAEKGEVDVAGMAKSYAELEKTRSQPKPAAAAAPAPAVDAAKKALEDAVVAIKAKADAKPEEIAAAEKAVADYKPAAPAASGKVDLAPFEQEFAEQGALSEESFTKLEGMGFSRSVVNAYIAGQQATVAAYEGKAHTAVGGKEQFAQMAAWAGSALTESEVEAFNDAVTSGNEAQMLLAVQGMHSKFVAANGQQPQLLGGGERGPGSVLAFRDKSEMTAAMRDPRYAKSEAYRQEVAGRLAVSKF